MEAGIKEKVLKSLVFIVFFCLLIGLFVAGRTQNEIHLDNKVSSVPKKWNVTRDSSLVNCIRIAYSDKTMWVPDGYQMREDCIIGKENDMDYLIFVAGMDEREDAYLSIMDRMYSNVLGKNTNVSILEETEGFIGYFSGRYALLHAKKTVSLRTESYYCMVYCIGLDREHELYVAVSTKGKKQAVSGQELLDHMISTITVYQDAQEEIKNILDEEAGKGGDGQDAAQRTGEVVLEEVRFPVLKDCDYIRVTIVSDGEMSLFVEAPDGEQLTQMGNVVDNQYFFKGKGILKAGTYRIFGSGIASAGLEGISKEEYDTLINRE